MSSYNWIAFERHCPTCDQQATAVAQIHLASSYDGDDTGRFHDRTYRVGESMSWWEPHDRRFASWADERDDVALDHASEVCFAECHSCGSEFNVMVTLKNFVVDSVNPTDQKVP